MGKILISGYYGFDNAGDDSVLYGIINSLQKHDASLQFSVLSNQPEKTEQMFGIAAYNRWNFIEVIGQLKKHDLLLMGGGSLLQDATSPRSVLYYLGTVVVAKMLKKPVVFYAQGVGPVTKKISKFLIRWIVNKVDVITVRDYESGEDLKKLGVIHRPIIVTADPAITIPASSINLSVGKNILNALNIDPQKTIAVSVREWKKEEHFKDILAEVADHYAALGWNIIFIPMQYPADILPSEEIRKRMKYKSNSYVIKKPLHFKEIMSLIGNIRLVLGMRLHSIILAAVMNVPFVGISYDPKIDRFVERIDMRLAGHIKNLQTDNVIANIDYIIDHEQEIKETLAKNITDIIANAEKSSELTIKQIK